MKGKYARGLETYIKILRQFAVSKELQQYDLDKTIEVSYRTVLRTLHDMEKREVLKIVRKEPSSKRGKNRNVWSITLKGLVDLLAGDEDIWKDINTVAKVHPEKLLIFRKWNFLEKENLQGFIIKNLRTAIRSFRDMMIIDSVLFSNSMKWTDESLRMVLDSMALGLHILRSFKKVSHKEWFNAYVPIFKVCKKDPELNKFVDTTLKFFERDAQETLDSIKEAQKFLASLP